MTILYIFLFYIVLGGLFISISLDQLMKEDKLPIKNLTKEQYIQIMIYGSLFWLPLIIYVFFNSKAELKSIIKDEEKIEKYKKERDEKNKK